MKVFTRLGALAALVALAFLVNPGATRAQYIHEFNHRACAWPLEMSPEGVANFQFPDNSARYWIMPFDSHYETMTIRGAYPRIRYFAFAAYDTVPNGETNDYNLVGHLYDAQISADPGTVNPFVPPPDGRKVKASNGSGIGTYTVVISRTGTSSGNTIAVPPNSDLVWILLRMYVADADQSLSGQSLMGRVPLPSITVTDQNGGSQQLGVCSPVNKWLDLSAFTQSLFPPAVDVSVDEGTPSSDRLWFAPPAKPPTLLWPNPDGKYMMMWPGDRYQPGRIIVIHGKAEGFPDTFNGSPVWVPSRGFRSVDVRFWAACIANFASPFSVVDCATDLTTVLEGGYYTIVISDDRQRPDWLRPNINWLPWGDEQYPKLMAFRNMVPATDFPYAVQTAWEHCGFPFSFDSLPDRSVLDDYGPCAQQWMGDYYPVAVWCDKSTFIAGGFQACLDERHANRGGQ
jgi:hypothetical protein